MPLCLPGSWISPVPFDIGTIMPGQHSAGISPAVKHWTASPATWFPLVHLLPQFILSHSLPNVHLPYWYPSSVIAITPSSLIRKHGTSFSHSPSGCSRFLKVIFNLSRYDGIIKTPLIDLNLYSNKITHKLELNNKLLMVKADMCWLFVVFCNTFTFN